MLFLKQVLDKCRLLLAPMQMAAHGGDHLGSVGWSALAHGVGLDVLVEQFIGVKLWAIAGRMIKRNRFALAATKRLARLERCTGWPSTIRYSLPEACLSSRLMNSTKPLAWNFP